MSVDILSRRDRRVVADADRARSLAGLATVLSVAIIVAVVVPQADVELYQRYGTWLLHGSSAHRLPIEYPALSAAVFALPLVAGSAYKVGFAVLMACSVLGLVAATERAVGAAWLGRFALYLGVGTAGVLLARYDVLPSFAAFLAVISARRSRYGAAWGAALVGAALKLFPLVLLPAIFIAEWRTSNTAPWRRVAFASVVAAAYVGIQSTLVPGSVWTPIRYELRRGFEFSSLQGSLTAISNLGHVHFGFNFGSWAVIGSHTGVIAAVTTSFEALSVLALLALLYRERLSVEEASLALLTVVVLCDRALAPQYLVWLIPLWALFPLRRMWLAAAMLTTLTFPLAFSIGLNRYGSLLPATAVAGLRNAVLLLGSAIWLAERLKASKAPSRSVDPGPRVDELGEGTSPLVVQHF